MHKPCCCGHWSWWWAHSSSGPIQLLSHWGWQRPGYAELACSRTPHWCLQQADRENNVDYYCPNRWPSYLHILIKPVKDKHSLYLSTWRQRESRLWWLSEITACESCLQGIVVIMPIDHIKPFSKFSFEEECPCHQIFSRHHAPTCVFAPGVIGLLKLFKSQI